MSEAQWRRRANALCKQSNKELNELSARAFAGLGPKDRPTAAQFAAFATAAVPSIEQTIASIDALDEPNAMAKDVAKWLALAREANAGMTTDPGPANDAQFARTNRLGKRIGIVCGN